LGVTLRRKMSAPPPGAKPWMTLTRLSGYTPKRSTSPHEHPSDQQFHHGFPVGFFQIISAVY